jgi:hypothetical protein
MQIAFLEPMSRAWDRMVGLLFRPFDPARWLVLGFAAWLAGLGGSRAGGSVSRSLDLEDMPGAATLGWPWTHSWEHFWALPFVALAILIVLSLAVLVLWVSSRAKLVWVDDLVTGNAAIVEPWNRLGRLGDSLFVWRLIFALVVIAALAVVAVTLVGPAALAAGTDVLAGMSFAAMFAGGTAAVVLGGAAAVVSLLLDSFVVPIMYRYQLSAIEAWRAFLPWLSAFPGQFVLYTLVALVLAMVFGAVSVVLLFVTCCVVAIPYVGTVLLLPVWVVWRLFSLEFLAQFDPGLDLFQRT